MYSSLILYWIISFLMLTSVFISINLLSKHISNKNIFFSNNVFANFILGAIMYFATSFFAFVPFLLIELNIIYFTIIFFIKEFFMYTFFILRREQINKINWKPIIWNIFCGIIIAIVYKFGISLITKPQQINWENTFQIWIKFKDVIYYFSGIPMDFLENWVFGIIAGTIVYCSIAALIAEFSKNQNFSKKILSLFIALISLLVFSMNLPLHHSIGVYFIVFLVVVAIRIISYSRRRYGFLFGTTSIVTWFFQPNLFLAILSLSLITLIIYIYLEKPKTSLFIIQLLIPNIIISSFFTNNITSWIFIILIIFSSFLYFFFFLSGNNKSLNKINKIIIKFKIIIPLIIFTIIVTIVSVYLFQNKINWEKLITIKTPVWSIQSNSTIFNYIQFFVYCTMSIFLFIFTIYLLIKKLKIQKYEILFCISLGIIFFIYNPFIDAYLKNSIFDNQIQFLKSIIMIPIHIIVLIKMTNIIFKTK